MKIDIIKSVISKMNDADYASYNASQDGLLVGCCVLCALVLAIGFGLATWLAICATKRENNAAQVMRKYETIDPKKVNASTLSSFHKELRDCFNSDAAYSNYVNNWASGKSIEISNIDTILLHYYDENRHSNDSDDEEY